MSFEINDANENVNSQFSYYTGILPFTVIAMNPTLAQTKEMGFNFNTEPEYVTKDKDGNSQTIVEIYLNNAPFSAVNKDGEKILVDEAAMKPLNLRFIIGHEFKLSRSGKTEYINDEGKSFYTDSPEELPDWFSKSGLRQAYPGEAKLYSFMYSLANLKKGQKCRLADVTKMFTGDFTELKTVMNSLFSSHRVKVLTGIKFSPDKEGNGFYTNSRAYSGYFWNHSQELLPKQHAKLTTHDEAERIAYSLDHYTFEPTVYTSGELIKFMPKPDGEEEIDNNSGDLVL